MNICIYSNCMYRKAFVKCLNSGPFQVTNVMTEVVPYWKSGQTKYIRLITLNIN